MALSAKPAAKASDHVKALYYVMQSMEVKYSSACPDHLHSHQVQIDPHAGQSAASRTHAMR